LFGFDAFYGGGSASILKEIPDLVQLAIFQSTVEHRLALTGSKTPLRPIQNPLLDLICEVAVREKPLSIPSGYVVGESGNLTEALVHLLYDHAVRTKKRNAEFLAKAILALALSLDIQIAINKSAPKQRRYHGYKEDLRLTSFMPPNPMKAMLKAVESHPFASRISEWNNKRLYLAKPASAE